MATWEYKSVTLERTGTKEDFGFDWTYGAWEVGIDQSGKQPMMTGLQQLGRAGWELAGAMPTDMWDEASRSGNAPHGIRTISCMLLFKRPAVEGASTDN
ncbi:MAG: hypothetical protein M1274_06540 [Actinobacteria bacterium]|nr:hypothetical protein [Actinomycetota bacterium]